jgi:hypothetical protein
MMRFVLVLVASVFLVVGGVAFAADNHPLSIEVIGFGAVNLNPGNAVVLQLNSTGVTGGSNAVTDSDNGNWLQYTFIVTGSTSRIDVTLTGGAEVPSWLTLQLVPGAVTSGVGTRGSVNTRTLTTAAGAQQLITGIGSCYTGTGLGTMGSQLTYNLSINDFGSAVVVSPALSYTVTFTAVP